MAIVNWTGTTGNDTIRFATYGRPSSTNTYTFDALAGTDTLDMVAGNNQYASRFISTNFIISAADANGVIVVTGASSGGQDHFTFNLKSVESIKFFDTTVQLSYGPPPPPIDTTPPTVSAYSPTDGATDVRVGSDIVLTFSEAIMKGSGAIELHIGSATGALFASYDAATSTNLTVSGNTLTINPTVDLSNGTHYFVTLAAGSIKDVAGNNYSGTTSYDFSTVAAVPAVDTTPPTVSAYSPTDGSTGVGVGSDIVLTFSEAIMKGSGAIELHIGSATGALFASYDAATSTNLTVSGNTLTINPTVDLSNGTHYFVTLAAGSIKDVAGNNYSGTTSYDFSTVAAVPAVDTTPPTVSGYNPTVGSTGVGVRSDIVLTFSEAVQRGAGVIELHSGSVTGALVASYDVATSTNITVTGNILTIHPTADLSNGTHYFVKLAAGSIKDVVGNNYAGTTAYDFSTTATTPAADTTPPTVSAYSPAVGANGIGVANNIVLTFSEAVQRGTGVIELHSGSATGSLVASYDAATSTNLTVSGNTLTINPSVDLVSGTHYFVTLAAGSIKDVAGNNYSGTTAYDFSTTSATPATDTTPPTVVTFSPANAATGVGISSDLVLTFSEAIHNGSGAIAIHNGSSTGAVVASSDDPMTESISISGSTLTIHHTNNLLYNTHYFVTFGQGSVNDLAGNHFDGTTPYDFFTEQAPIPVLNPGTGGGNSDIAPVIVGGGILGALSWVLFL